MSDGSWVPDSTRDNHAGQLTAASLAEPTLRSRCGQGVHDLRPRLDIIGPRAGHDRRDRSRGMPPRLLRRIEDYIEVNLDSALSMDELAIEIGLSKSYFARTFRKAVGVTPHCYVVQRRLARAQELLLRTNRSLADIALATGFSDQSHFCRRFHQVIGATPGAFRFTHTDEQAAMIDNFTVQHCEHVSQHIGSPWPGIPKEGRQIMTMNRRTFSATVIAGAAASLVSTRGMPATPAPAKARNVVLVHGLFADGSCWSEVIARLQEVGLNATSVQNPLTTLPDAVASTQRVLDRQDGPTVLVGHSFSGMIVTEAGVHPNVLGLVYVAARAPDAGEDYAVLAKTFPTPPASAGILFDGDEGRLSEAAFLRDFAGDLPEAKAKVLYAVQEPFQKALLTAKTAHAAWRSKPSFYAVSTEDRTINPDLERFMAKRMRAKTIELKSSHLSLISHPDEITQLILEAAGQASQRDCRCRGGWRWLSCCYRPMARSGD